MRGINNFNDIGKIYNTDENKCIKRGDVYYIHKDSASGSEQIAGRPGVIVGNDIGNEKSPVVIIVFVTTQKKSYLPTHVEINTLPEKSTVLCEQIVTVSKERIGNYICRVTDEEMRLIDKALAVSIDLKKYEKSDLMFIADSKNPLLEKAKGRVEQIIGSAKKIKQVDNILANAKTSSGVCLIGSGVVKLEGIISEKQMGTLKDFAIQQVESEKNKEEKNLEVLLGLKEETNSFPKDNKPLIIKPDSIKPTTGKSKLVYLTKDIRKKLMDYIKTEKKWKIYL